MHDHTRRFAILLAATTLIAALTPTMAFAERTIGLSSGTFRFDVEAGEDSSGTVYLSNDGDEDVRVLVYAADQEVDESGNLAYDAPTRADITQLDRPSSWISVKMPSDSKSLGNVPYIELKPGERVPISFSITVPTSIQPGDHNLLLFFEMFDRSGQQEGAATVVSGRIGSRITMRVKGELFSRITMRPFEVPAFVIGSSVPYRAVVNQDGNIDQRVSMAAALRNRSGNDIASQTPIDSLLVFAGESREASGSLTGNGPLFGSYTVAVDLTQVDDEGRPLDQGADTITEERSVFMVPLWAVIAAGALLVLVMGWVIWAFGRRSGKAKAQMAAKTEPPAVTDPAAPE